MKNQQIVATLIALAVVAWMFVPRAETVNEEPDSSPEARVVAIQEGQSASESPETITVRAIRVAPQSYTERIRVRGRTEAIRMVEVRAEQAGRIVSEPVARGARVREGDTLCEIDIDNRNANLAEAMSRREQAEFEYQAALDLQQRDLQSDVAVAQFKANLESARAAVARAELALQDTRMVAPFDGIVESRVVELGDLLNVGTVCATVLDDDPMLLVGLIPEQEIGRIQVGARVNAELITGERVTGSVRFLARSADPVSRSYRIEVEVDPSDVTIRSGLTAELLVETAEIQAYLIPSSALTLDDNGNIGVKIIDRNGTVQARSVTIVGDDTNQLNPGIWVTGFSGAETLITLGQEIVFPGQYVEANFEWDN